VDLSGHVTGAGVNAADGATAVEFLTVSNVDERTLRVVWPGSPCDTVHRLTIAADFGITIDRPHCFGDAMLVIRAVRIDFDVPVDAAIVDTGLFDGRPDSGVPSWTVTGVSSGGGRFDLAIFDHSGSVERAETIGDTTGATDPGARVARVEQIARATLRFTWRGPTCATSSRLVIDDSGTNWELQTDPCSTNIVEVIRSVDITFSAPRAAAAVSISSSTARP
jgi:hypothetical protein